MRNRRDPNLKDRIVLIGIIGGGGAISEIRVSKLHFNFKA